MKHLYGVFATIDGTRRFALLPNKRRALRLAAQHPDAEVRVTSAACFDGGDQYGIDAPTFRVMSDPLQATR